MIEEKTTENHAETLAVVAEHLRVLRYGRIVIFVHQSEVQDIDVTNRIRVSKRTRKPKTAATPHHDD